MLRDILQIIPKILINPKRQSMLHKRTDIPPVLSMTISHRKEMAVFEAHNVGMRDVGVLIHFSGVVW